MRRREGACVAWAFVLLVAAQASAQPREVALRYVAPGTCPSRGDLEQRIEALAPRAVFADGSGEAQRFEVRIDRRGRTFVGALRAGVDGSTRTVAGETCEDVVGALALVAAIAIDPTAIAAPPAPDPVPVSAPLSPPVPAPPTPDPLPRPDPPPVETAPLVLARSPAEPDRVPSRASRWRIDLGAGAEVRTAFAQTPLYGAAVAAGIRGRGDLAPAISAGFAYDTGSSAAARFALATGEADGCLHRALGRSWVLAPCVQVDLGQARATGVQVAHPGEANRLWSDVSALARARVHLTREIYAEASAGPSLSLTRPTYVFEDPYVVVHHVPLVGFYAAVSAGVAVW
jgi:hypothetical protein